MVLHIQLCLGGPQTISLQVVWNILFVSRIYLSQPADHCFFFRRSLAVTILTYGIQLMTMYWNHDILFCNWNNFNTLYLILDWPSSDFLYERPAFWPYKKTFLKLNLNVRQGKLISPNNFGQSVQFSQLYRSICCKKILLTIWYCSWAGGKILRNTVPLCWDY